MPQALQAIRSATFGPILTAVLLPAVALAVMPGSASALEPEEESAGIVTAQIPVDGSDIASGQAVIVVDKPIDREAFLATIGALIGEP